MASNLITNKELRGVRVLGGKNGTKSIGKVRYLVFHPRERRVVGFTVKRPDLALMFHRKDMFVSLQGFDVVDGRIVVRETPEACDKGACKALGIDYDQCVLWEGLPMMTESGETLGLVGEVTFDARTGAIATVMADAGATANTLLGKRIIPVKMIRGFRRGIGAALVMANDAGAEQDEEEVVYGAVLVSDEALNLPVEGSVAEKAGQATAVAVDKVNRTVKPAVSEAAKKTGEAVNKGARATGKRIAQTKDALVGFKEEYQKAAGKKPEPSAKSSSSKGEHAEKELPAESSAPKGDAKKTAAKAPAKKNMFAAFKDEYDKARRGE